MENVNKEDLTEYDKPYNDSKVKESGDFEDLPDGKYQVVIDGCKMGFTRESNKPMLTWELKIISGKYKNRLMWKNTVWQDNTMGIVKGDIRTCGVEIENVSDLADDNVRVLFLDIVLEVTQKTGEKYTNLYFNKKIDGSSAPPVPPTQSETDIEDDLPF